MWREIADIVWKTSQGNHRGLTPIEKFYHKLKVNSSVLGRISNVVHIGYDVSHCFV